MMSIILERRKYLKVWFLLTQSLGNHFETLSEVFDLLNFRNFLEFHGYRIECFQDPCISNLGFRVPKYLGYLLLLIFLFLVFVNLCLLEIFSLSFEMQFAEAREMLNHLA